MATKMRLICSYPPSNNTYYRHIRSGKLAGRTLISERGRSYRAKLKTEIVNPLRMDSDLEVKIYLYPPDARKRDIDNCLKALFDSLTHAGVWIDDSQVKRLYVEMLEKRKNGECHIEITQIGNRLI